MRRATAVLPAAGAAAAATITLAAAERHRRRVMLTDDAGAPFLLDLAKAVQLKDGDGLLLEDGGIIAVRAAEEDVVDLAASPLIAWHIGNRHVPVQLLADGGLRLPADPVLLDLLQRQGVPITRRRAPFQPEPGAYEAHGLFNHLPAVTLLPGSAGILPASSAGPAESRSGVRAGCPRSQALLRLMAWLSPAFPVGGFSYSHGLERAVEVGLVRDLATTVDWIATVLTDGAGRSDSSLLLEAHRAADDQPRLDAAVALADALRPTAELALEATGQGNAFLATVAAAWPDPWWEAWKARLKGQARGLAYPVAVGVAAARAGIAEDDALAAYLQAFAANLVSAALRLVPLGQSDGQRAVAALEGTVLAATGAALRRPFADIGGAAAMVDWCSMTHETQYTRLFRS